MTQATLDMKQQSLLTWQDWVRTKEPAQHPLSLSENPSKDPLWLLKTGFPPGLSLEEKVPASAKVKAAHFGS